MTYEEFKEKVGSVILTGEGNCPVTPVVQMLQGKWKLQIPVSYTHLTLPTT